MSNQGSVFPPGHTRPPDNVVETFAKNTTEKDDNDRVKSSAEGLEMLPESCSIVDVKTSVVCMEQTDDAVSVSADDVGFRIQTDLDEEQILVDIADLEV